MRTQAILQAERIENFVSDKDTYALSVASHKEGTGRPDGKTHK